MRFRVAIAHILTLGLSAAAMATDPSKVDRWVTETAARGQTEFLVMLRAQADLRGARSIATKTEKGPFIADALSATAAQTQAPILDLLVARGAEHRSYWIANMIWVRGDRSLVDELAARDDVFHIYANPSVRLRLPAAPA